MILGAIRSQSQGIKFAPSLNLILTNLKKLEFKHGFRDKLNSYLFVVAWCEGKLAFSFPLVFA